MLLEGSLLAHDVGVAPSPWAQLFVVFLVADGLAHEDPVSGPLAAAYLHHPRESESEWDAV